MLIDVHASELLFKFVDNFLIFVKIDLSTELGVFFDILHKHGVVFLVFLGSHILVLLLRLAAFFFVAVLLLEMLELPDSVLLSLSELRICLLDKYHGRHLNFPIILDVIKLH